ncbi:hypothetical protein [Thalassospira aquimaris]|uniref:Uncharacterized protein n=1 Tax=Thalassospira aquimaris TaxID=3037796 RepID=A0ABT6GGH1_9PROT|nr:hypothetical protein [Thalassospira sp. FZY0004]MDG4721179.1 hypothetical protein [Thalassospira sp. FZY0004]
MGQLKANNAKKRAAEEKGQEQPRLAGTEKQSEMVNVIPAHQFDRMVAEIRETKSTQAESNTSNASAFKRFKKAGGNNEALQFVLKVTSMSDDKAADLLRCIRAYGDRLGMFDGVGDLFANDPVAKSQDAKPLDALKSKEDTKEEQGAYEAGIASCKFGRDRDSNPHDASKKPKEHAAFDRGWLAAFEGGQKGSMKQGGGEDGDDQPASADNVTALPQKPNGGDAKASAADGKA